MATRFFLTFLTILLSGCTLQSTFPGHMHLGRDTAAQLFDAAGVYLQPGGATDYLTFTCTVVEGTRCWFDDDPDSGAIASDLTDQIVRELGWKFIEHSAYNQVTVRCGHMIGSYYGCSIDRGGGFQPLPIETCGILQLGILTLCW